MHNARRRTCSESASALALRSRCTACDCFFCNSFSFRAAFAAFLDSRTAAARAISSALFAEAVLGVGGAVAGTVLVLEDFADRDDGTGRDPELDFFALGVAATVGVGATLFVT